MNIGGNIKISTEWDKCKDNMVIMIENICPTFHSYKCAKSGIEIQTDNEDYSAYGIVYSNINRKMKEACESCKYKSEKIANIFEMTYEPVE